MNWAHKTLVIFFNKKIGSSEIVHCNFVNLALKKWPINAFFWARHRKQSQLCTQPRSGEKVDYLATLNLLSSSSSSSSSSNNDVTAYFMAHPVRGNAIGYGRKKGNGEEGNLCCNVTEDWLVLLTLFSPVPSTVGLSYMQWAVTLCWYVVGTLKKIVALLLQLVSL